LGPWFSINYRTRRSLYAKAPARSTRTSMRWLAVFDLTFGKKLRHVVLPQLVPYLAAAMRSGLSLVWKIVLIVELLGRSNGVGFEIGIAFQLFDVTRLLAYALPFVGAHAGN